MQILLAAALLGPVAATTHAQIVPFNPERWEIQARESKVIDHLGRRSLYMKGGDAAVKNSQFTDGASLR